MTTLSKPPSTNPVIQLFQLALQHLGGNGGQLTEPQKRAISLNDIFRQVLDQAYKLYPQAYLLDLYEDAGAMFAIFTQDGKLYRSPVLVQDSIATLGTWSQVEVQFSDVPGGQPPEDKPPVQEIYYLSKKERSHLTILRQGNKYRFFSVSCTSVINRSGQIDSSDLFKAFETNFNRRAVDAPPVLRTFYHAGEAFRTGVIDYVAADGYTLITSGLYDDSELAQHEIRAHEAEPDYWGESIEFVPTQDALLMRVADGISIPIYTEGFLTAVSTLPESQAAALFTVTHQEVIRMATQRNLTQAQHDAFVKLFQGDEAAANSWLEKNPDALNRMIRDGKLIARGQVAAEPAPAATVTTTITTTPVTPEAAAPAAQPAAPATATTPEASAEAEPVRREFEMTDELMDALTEHILKSPTLAALAGVPDAVAGLTQQLGELSKNISAQATRQASANTDLEKRLAAIERPETEKREEWLHDLPPASRSPRREIISIRPRQARATDAPADGAEPETDAAATANETLSQMKTRSAR